MPSERTAPTRSLVLVMAIATGVTVASLYYVQPLLPIVEAEFHVGSTAAGLTVSLSQLGFAVGLAAVVPLADVLTRRKLAVGLLALLAAAMVVAASSPSVAVLIGASVLIGLGVTAAQVIVPFAASMADDASRGRVVGTVMTGMLVGTLLARTVVGLLADAAGWRIVYWGGAVLVTLVACVLARRLLGRRPARAPELPGAAGVDLPRVPRGTGAAQPDGDGCGRFRDVQPVLGDDGVHARGRALPLRREHDRALRPGRSGGRARRELRGPLLRP